MLTLLENYVIIPVFYWEVVSMNFLEERILKDGIVKPGNVLKVDSFLNHQMDTKLMEQIGKEFKRRFAGKNIDKVLTIELSEKQISGRTISLSIDYEDVLSADSFNHILLEEE